MKDKKKNGITHITKGNVFEDLGFTPEEAEQLEYEIIFEPAAQLKADVIWVGNKPQSEASTE